MSCTYLNLVLEYFPETVYCVSKHYSRANQRMPMICVKLYTYQIIRLLEHQLERKSTA
ncbi:unnamed protein product [Brassica napus]|uniref:(rape) hypothetical protein n=1 Tax=Brassica napus TaxID=3708 RepID=A0A816V486_BRANA|nr:unnamed protein product [Brassica napus]